MMSAFLFIKYPYCKIEIACKNYPHNIGQLQISRYLVKLFKGYYRSYYRKKQKEKPYKCKKIFLKAEEDNAPRKIYNKAGSIKRKSVLNVDFRVAFAKIYHCGADTHKDIKHCPHNRENCRRRSKRWLCKLRVYI